MNDLIQIVKTRKGWDNATLSELNDYTPVIPNKTEQLADILNQNKNAEITILPDFDTDGICAGVILYAGLHQLGFNSVNIHIPDYHLGHDIQPQAIDEVKQLYPNTQIIITCDAGINSHKGIARAKELGMTIFVTDHHIELNPGCSADFAINPNSIGEPSTRKFSEICGAMVAYRLIETYMHKYAPQFSQLISYLALFAGLGTVADVMPTLYENRKIIKKSVALTKLCFVEKDDTQSVHPMDAYRSSMLLQLLERDPNCAPQLMTAIRGYVILINMLIQLGKIQNISRINEDTYGFTIAPALNATRRIDADKVHNFGLFVFDNIESQIACATQVIENNNMRKVIVEDLFNGIIEGTDGLVHMPPYLYFCEAASGTYGLLANKLIDHNQLPAMVINPKTLDGSMRSPEWFPFLSIMTEGGFKVIGHEGAAGVRFSSMDEVSRAIEYLDAKVNEILALQTLDAIGEQTTGFESDADLILGDHEMCDAPFDDLDEIQQFINDLENLRPFGRGFEMPKIEVLLDLNNVEVKPMSNGKHLKLTTLKGTQFIFWNVSDRQKKICSDTKNPLLRLYARPDLNSFQGTTCVQYIVDRIINM